MNNKPIRIIRYRVDLWLDKNSGGTKYGVSVKIEGWHKWARVAEDSKPVLFDAASDASDYIAHMKSERDSRGYKAPQMDPELVLGA